MTRHVTRGLSYYSYHHFLHRNEMNDKLIIFLILTNICMGNTLLVKVMAARMNSFVLVEIGTDESRVIKLLYQHIQSI